MEPRGCTPDYLAGVLTGTQGSATDVFAQKIDVVFLAIQEASAGAQDISTFSPEGMMWFGAMLFMLGTVGLLVTTKIALGVLVALGPLFVVMALFNGTRGLFTGWVKGLTLCALAPLFAVLGGGVMLELAVPILGALTATPAGRCAGHGILYDRRGPCRADGAGAQGGRGDGRGLERVRAGTRAGRQIRACASSAAGCARRCACAGAAASQAGPQARRIDVWQFDRLCRQ